MHCKVEHRESYRSRLLDPVNTLEGPFTMIFDWIMTSCFSFVLSVKHTIVTAITLAIPLFPLHIKRFLHVPWTINGDPVRREIALWKASLRYTSGFSTLFYTSPIKWISITSTGI